VGEFTPGDWPALATRLDDIVCGQKTASSMIPSSRTPEGQPNRCPVCGKSVRLEPSNPPGDAPCPHCGHLLWFASLDSCAVFSSEESEARELSADERIQLRVASALREQAKGNHEAAIELLSSAVRARPADPCYRRLLRIAEYGKYQNQRPKRGWPWSKAAGCVRRLRKARRIQDWKEIERAAEDCLKYDPWHVEANLELAKACQQLGYRDTAAYAYECVLDTMRGRADVREAMERLMKS
jgi:hypothetical protein